MPVLRSSLYSWLTAHWILTGLANAMLLCYLLVLDINSAEACSISKQTTIPNDKGLKLP